MYEVIFLITEGFTILNSSMYVLIFIFAVEKTMPIFVP